MISEGAMYHKNQERIEKTRNIVETIFRENYNLDSKKADQLINDSVFL